MFATKNIFSQLAHSPRGAIILNSISAPQYKQAT